MNRRFLTWLLLSFLLGLSIMASYFFSQQDARAAINVPLIQMVQTVETSLAAGIAPVDVLAGREIDLSVNQNPFLTLYAKDKTVIGSSAHKNGVTLLLPSGILDRARNEGEVKVTWQPTSQLRFASVTRYVPSFGFISAAESLKAVESEAMRNLARAFMLWFFGALIAGAGMVLIGRYAK